MGLLLSKRLIEPHNAVERALERSAQIALIVSLAMLGIAGIFFLMLYLIAH